MTNKWTPEYMRTTFVEEVRQKRIDQGLDPNEKPTHEWLRNNGYRQFLRRARELGYTPDEFLIEECGFERSSSGFPCDDDELLDNLEAWLEFHEEIAESRSDSTMVNVRSHFRRLMEIADDSFGSRNLLELGRGEQEVCETKVELLLKGLIKEYDNPGSRGNVLRPLVELFEWLEDKDEIDHNLIGTYAENIGWTPRDTSPPVLSSSQVKQYFEACETAAEQALILCLAGLGVRPSDLVGEPVQETFQFEAEVPHLTLSHRRKNGAGRVPILVGDEFLKQYIERLRRDPLYNGAVFPSDLSESGSRTTQWMRDTVSKIGDRIDVTLPNGEKPTPRDFRRFWYTLYLDAHIEFKNSGGVVSPLQGSNVPDSSTTYAGDSPWFEQFSSRVTPALEAAFPNNLPERVADELGNIDVDPGRDVQHEVTDYESEHSTVSPGNLVVSLLEWYDATLDDLIDRGTAIWGQHTDRSPMEALVRTDRRRKVTSVILCLAAFLTIVQLFVRTGIYIDPFSGEMPSIGLNLLLTVYFAIEIQRREGPVIEEQLEEITGIDGLADTLTVELRRTDDL